MANEKVKSIDEAIILVALTTMCVITTSVENADAIELGIGAGLQTAPISGITSELRAAHFFADWLSVRMSVGYAFAYPDQTIYYSSADSSLTSQALRLGIGFQLRHPNFRYLYAGITPVYLIDSVSNDSRSYFRYVQYNIGATVPLSVNSSMFFELANSQWYSPYVLTGITVDL